MKLTIHAVPAALAALAANAALAALAVLAVLAPLAPLATLAPLTPLVLYLKFKFKMQNCFLNSFTSLTSYAHRITALAGKWEEGLRVVEALPHRLASRASGGGQEGEHQAREHPSAKVLLPKSTS